METTSSQPMDPTAPIKPAGEKTASNPATVTDVTSDDEFSAIISSFPSTALLIIYFHAPWAEPCKQMRTVLETLASTYKATTPPSISFISLNAEELPEISEQYEVTAVPYIVLQKDGSVLDKVSGSDASRVRAVVEKHAGQSGIPGIPPAQQVTKPAENGGAKNLSSYAPTSHDSVTAPDTTSGETDKEELQKRLEGLVKAAPVMLFMKGTPSAPQCGFSRQTVALLRERSIRYGFFNILADDDVRQGLKEYSDWPTFPQLYADGELVGGLDIVREEFQNSPDFLMEYSVKPHATA